MFFTLVLRAIRRILEDRKGISAEEYNYILNVLSRIGDRRARRIRAAIKEVGGRFYIL